MTTSVPSDEPNDRSILAPDVDLAARPQAAEEGAPEPDLKKLGDALGTDLRIRSIGTTGLFVLALCYTLYFARAFFLPIVIALLLDFLLSPVVRALGRARIPTPLGAALVLTALLGTIGVGAYEISEPAKEWIARAPQTIAGLREELQRLRKPVEEVTETAKQVEEATSVTRPDEAPEVVVKGPSLTERVFGTTQSFVVGAVEVFVLLYFLLAAGDLFLEKLIKVLPQLRDKKKAVRIARETESSVSVYLSTVILVNIGEGIVVALAMLALGMPNPVLWGVLFVFLEFVPYLGAVAMTVILTLASLSTFDSLGRALLVPATFVAINFVQAYLVSPLILGRRLTLNPVAILVGVVFWFWIWGVPGAFLAVPLIATFKIVCDHTETLAPMGEFLGK